MIPFNGISSIFAHIKSLFTAIGNIFLNLPIINVFSGILPPDLIAIIGVLISLAIVMATFGLIKKVSFMLG